MNHLQSLRADILSIPDKRKRSNFVGTIRQYSDRAKKSRDSLKNAVHGQKHVALIFPENGLLDSVNKASKAISTARSLVGKVSRDPNAIQGKAADTAIANIASLADSSLNDLRTQWKRLVLGKIQAFQSLVKAAEEAKLQGSSKLRTLIDSLGERANTPPYSIEQAEIVKQQLDDLVTSLSAIGLEGEVGIFLIDAAKGSANPQALFDPVVKEFVERHDLWRLLRVKLS